MNNPPKVLIVEDEAILAMLYRRRLKSRGYDVTGIAATMEESVSLAFKDPPDFVLMDIRLAGDNSGIAAAREIAAHINTRTIFMTGYSDEKIKNMALELHPLAYLVKPFDLQELLACMKNVKE